MNYKDAFQGLDDIPLHDPLFVTWELLHYNYLQAEYEGDREGADAAERERDAWMCEVLTRWWHLPPPRWTGVVH
jgi:hypothetical protein